MVIIKMCPEKKCVLAFLILNVKNVMKMSKIILYVYHVMRDIIKYMMNQLYFQNVIKKLMDII